MDQLSDIIHAAIDRSEEGVTIFDLSKPGWPYIYANDGFQLLTGYTAQEVVGESFHFLEGRETNPDDVSRVRDAMDKKEPCTIVMVNYRKEGGSFHNRIHLYPVVADHKDYYVGIQWDVSSIVHIEKELETCTAMLEEGCDPKDFGRMIQELRALAGQARNDHREPESNVLENALPRELDLAMILDDDKTTRRMLEKAMDRLGFNPLSFATGESLQTFLEAGSRLPALILLDWELPDLEGIDVLRRIRELKELEFVPVLMLTGRTDESDIVKALEAGADDYLVKPLKYKELAARIRTNMRVKRMMDHLKVKNTALEEMSLTDPLTGLFNRRHMEQQLGCFWAREQRRGRALSVLAVDIDHFKRINDSYGHDAGDEVLKKLAISLRESCRQEDFACRLGGEEFLLVLPETDHEQAMVVAERLRKRIENDVTVVGVQEICCTASIGLADSRNDDITSEADLLKKADEMLYRAKSNGRNRVESLSAVSGL